MESLEPWMLIVGLLCMGYAVMVVLWVVAWKNAPKTVLGPLVVDHRAQAADRMVKESFLQKWFRRLTTM